VGSSLQLSAFANEDVGRSVEIEISRISELPDPSYLRVGGENRHVRWARVPKAFSGTPKPSPSPSPNLHPHPHPNSHPHPHPHPNPKPFSGKLSVLEVDDLGSIMLEGKRQLENPELAGTVLVFPGDHPELAGTVAAGTVAAGTVIAGGQGQEQGQEQEQEQKLGQGQELGQGQGQGQAALRHVVWERRPPKLLGRLTITKVDSEPPYALTLEEQSAPAEIAPPKISRLQSALPEAGLEIADLRPDRAATAPPDLRPEVERAEIAETSLEMQSEMQSHLEVNELTLENPGRATTDHPEPLAPATLRARRLHCRAWTCLCSSSAASVAPQPYAALGDGGDEEEGAAAEVEAADQQREARVAHLQQMAVRRVGMAILTMATPTMATDTYYGATYHLQVRRFGKASLARGWHAWLESREVTQRHATLALTPNP